MTSKTRRLASYAVMLLAGLLLVGFGGLSAHAVHLRVKQVSEGKLHRTILSSERCSTCHTSKHKAPLVGECENCHVTSTWQSVSYRHEKPYLNADAHGRASCNSCHPGGLPVRNASCETCHRTYNHRASTQCQTCHTTSSWTVSHALPRTHPRLEGTHAKTACPDCHTIHSEKRVYSCGDCHRKKHDKIAATSAHKDKKCVDCHIQKRKKDRLNKVTVRGTECSGCHGIPHKSLTDCAKCHASSTFKKASFTHPKAPLEGSHAKLPCDKCHPKRQWAKNKGTACTSCHKVEHRGLVACTRCHNQTAWQPSTFVHSSAYKLEGAHSKLSCGKCHPRRQWSSTLGTACSSCHGTKHGGEKKCDNCHTTAAWKPARFDHSSTWALTGAHKTVSCRSCHPGGRWSKSKGTTCVACHGKKHGGETTCDSCHTTRSWSPVKPIRHSGNYSLVGQHLYVECESCHKQLVFRGTPTDCDSCHSAESHGMPNCERCHTPVSWKKILPHMGGGM